VAGVKVPDIGKYIDRIEDKIRNGRQIDAAADAMADSLRQATGRYLGGLSMSGTGRAVSVEAGPSSGHSITVRSGGAYGLADSGRRRAVPAVAAPGRALQTPWGPRQRVRGSTWAGFNITERHAAEAFSAGIAAYMNELDWFDG
jgi:hypothetical protein